MQRERSFASRYDFRSVRGQRLERGAGAVLVQGAQGGRVGLGKALVAGEVAEEVAVGDEGGGILALALGDLGQLLRAAVDDLDRLAVLVDALGVAGPGRDDRGRAPD